MCGYERPGVPENETAYVIEASEETGRYERIERQHLDEVQAAREARHERKIQERLEAREEAQHEYGMGLRNDSDLSTVDQVMKWAKESVRDYSGRPDHPSNENYRSEAEREARQEIDRLLDRLVEPDTPTKAQEETIIDQAVLKEISMSTEREDELEWKALKLQRARDLVRDLIAEPSTSETAIDRIRHRLQEQGKKLSDLASPSQDKTLDGPEQEDR